MAITDAQKVDLLYKKIGFGVAKTDTSAFKSPSNEANASPLLTRGDTIWVESGLIPGVKPASNSSVLVLYQQSLSSAVECTLDTTVSGTNRTWLTNYNDWISAEFGPSYQVKVYAAPAGNTSPETYGTQLFADGSGNADAWYFDYQSGILNFPDTNVPSSVTGKKIYVVGARYVGLKGVGTLANLNIGNLSVDSISINNAAILGGYLSNIANITAITANLSSLYSNIINVTSSNIQTGFVGNLSTGNAVINGGYISSLSNITTTTGNTTSWYATELNSTNANLTNAVVTNFSTGNALVSGGVIYNVNLQANNFSTANALITGGVLNNIDVQANNFSTANALITGGNVTANIIGNISGTFGQFASNVTANWFIGNVDAQQANFSGNVYINADLTTNGNLVAAGNVITQKITSPVGDLHFSAATNNPNNIIRFDSVSAFDIPSGNIAQRPPNPDYGYVRYNTDAQSIEWWGGNSWVAGASAINTQSITPDGTSITYTLDSATTEAGIIVNINGTIQQPGSAYTVTGNQITFASIPLVDDIIEIRFIAAGVVAASFYGGSIAGNVHITANTESTSTSTGALVVDGGIGVVGNLHLGGNVNISSTTGTPGNTASPAGWLKIYVGGSQYYLPLYQ